jgi:hypothetical protein
MIFKTTLKFNEKDAQEIVKKYILTNCEKFGMLSTDKITNVRFTTNSRWEGYGMGEHQVTEFDNIEVEITRNTDID